MILPSSSLAVAGTVISVETVALPVSNAPETNGFTAILAISMTSAGEPASSNSPATIPPENTVVPAAGPAAPGKTLPFALPPGKPMVPDQLDMVHPEVVKTAKGGLPEEARDAGSETTDAAVPPPALPLMPRVEFNLPAVNIAIVVEGLPDAAPVVVPNRAALAPTPPAAAPTFYSKALPPLHDTSPALAAQASEQAERRVPIHTADAIESTVSPNARRTPFPGVVKSPQKATAISSAAVTLSIPLEAVRLEVPLPVRLSKVLRAPLAPAEITQIARALPRPAAPTAIVPAEPGPAAALTELTLPEVVLQPPSSSTPPQIAPATHINQQLRPHDFATLIDRLSIAREAAAPQAVSITVAHQDFGLVRLNFGPQDAGLTVAITSADPAFARAAAAAPAPVVPVVQGEQVSFTQARNDNSPAQSGQSGGFTQSRGQHFEQRESQSQPHSSPSPRTGQNRPTPRQGIFA